MSNEQTSLIAYLKDYVKKFTCLCLEQAVSMKHKPKKSIFSKIPNSNI